MAILTRASLVAQLVKNLPAMQDTQVQSLGWENPLEKEMATHSSVLAWRIPEKGEPGGLPSMGSHKVKHDWGDLAAAAAAAAAYSAFLLFFIAATFYFPDFLFQFFKLFSVLGSWRRERRTLKLLLHIWFSFIPKFIFMFWVELFPPKIYMIKP